MAFRFVLPMRLAKQTDLFGPRVQHVRAHIANRDGTLVQVHAHDRKVEVPKSEKARTESLFKLLEHPGLRPLKGDISRLHSRLVGLGHEATCGRCGGSGSFSFNRQHGTMCYGCQGSGKVAPKITADLYRKVAHQVADMGLDAYVTEMKAKGEAMRAAKAVSLEVEAANLNMDWHAYHYPPGGGPPPPFSFLSYAVHGIVEKASREAATLRSKAEFAHTPMERDAKLKELLERRGEFLDTVAAADAVFRRLRDSGELAADAAEGERLKAEDQGHTTESAARTTRDAYNAHQQAARTRAAELVQAELQAMREPPEPVDLPRPAARGRYDEPEAFHLPAGAYKIIGFKDLRPLDLDTGERIPIPLDQHATCERCGKLHVRVFTVHNLDTGHVFSIGSGCAERALAGFDPKGDDVKRVKQVARNEEKAQQVEAEKHEVEKYARDVLAKFATMKPPGIEVTEEGPHEYNPALIGRYVRMGSVQTFVDKGGDRYYQAMRLENAKRDIPRNWRTTMLHELAGEAGAPGRIRAKVTSRVDELAQGAAPLPMVKASPAKKSATFRHPETGEVRTGALHGSGARGATIVDHESGEAHQVQHGHYAITEDPKEPAPTPQEPDGEKIGPETHPGLTAYPGDQAGPVRKASEGAAHKFEWEEGGQTRRAFDRAGVRSGADAKFQELRKVATGLPELRDQIDHDLDLGPSSKLARLAVAANVVDVANAGLGIAEVKRHQVAVKGGGLEWGPLSRRVKDPRSTAIVAHLVKQGDGDAPLLELTAAELREYIGKHLGASPEALARFQATRTWAELVDKVGPPEGDEHAEAQLRKAADRVAKVLGVTPEKALDRYIDPSVVRAYRRGLTLSGTMAKAEPRETVSPSEHRFAAFLDRVHEHDPFDLRKTPGDDDVEDHATG